MHRLLSRGGGGGMRVARDIFIFIPRSHVGNVSKVSSRERREICGNVRSPFASPGLEFQSIYRKDTHALRDLLAPSNRSLF